MYFRFSEWSEGIFGFYLLFYYQLLLLYFQTSNGTIVGNLNLIEFEEHQLNDLDMIVLASGDEGVVLQYIDQMGHSIISSKICVSFIFTFKKI